MVKGRIYQNAQQRGQRVAERVWVMEANWRQGSLGCFEGIRATWSSVDGMVKDKVDRVKGGDVVSDRLSACSSLHSSTVRRAGRLQLLHTIRTLSLAFFRYLVVRCDSGRMPGYRRGSCMPAITQSHVMANL